MGSRRATGIGGASTVKAKEDSAIQQRATYFFGGVMVACACAYMLVDWIGSLVSCADGGRSDLLKGAAVLVALLPVIVPGVLLFYRVRRGPQIRVGAFFKGEWWWRWIEEATVHRGVAALSSLVLGSTLLGCRDLHSVQHAEAVQAIPTYSSTFGLAVAGIGDLDGDGLSDFAVADPGRSTPSWDWTYQSEGNRGRVWILSGANGQVLSSFESPALDDGFGCSISACSDISGDGLPDLVVGTQVLEPNEVGMVYLYSAVDGVPIRTLSGQGYGRAFGFRVAGDADVRGTTPCEVIVSSKGSGAANLEQALLFSGSTGELVLSANVEGGRDLFPPSVGWSGDVDEDGVSDFFCVGSGASGDSTVVTLFSGINGAPISSWNHPGRHDIGRVGDIDGDGLSELSARKAVVQVLRLSSSRIEAIYEVVAEGEGCVLSLEDSTGEALRRIVIGESGWSIGAGRVRALAFSPEEQQIHTAQSGEASWHFGQCAAAVGDLDGDQVQDLVIGSDASLARDVGRAWLVSGRTGEIIFSMACPSGGTPEVSRVPRVR